MVVHTQKETLAQVLASAVKKKKIGFVPTMGALHAGHISLVKRALENNDLVVVSIFVNPTQFDNVADLEKYPRTPEADIALLQKLDGNVIAYLPTVTDLYDSSVSAKKYNFGSLGSEMEGKHRKGHFDGVATIVGKLLKIVRPATAYFGEKDFQQLQIVKKLVAKEKLPVTIVGCPILREKNGLAMSSRNKRLTPKQFQEATLLYKTLEDVREKFSSTSIAQLNSLVAERFLRNPHLELEYFEIANEKTLKTAKRKRSGAKYRAFVAAYAGDVRLIDNMPLN